MDVKVLNTYIKYLNNASLSQKPALINLADLHQKLCLFWDVTDVTRDVSDVTHVNISDVTVRWRHVMLKTDVFYSMNRNEGWHVVMDSAI